MEKESSGKGIGEKNDGSHNEKKSVEDEQSEKEVLEKNQSLSTNTRGKRKLKQNKVVLLKMVVPVVTRHKKENDC